MWPTMVQSQSTTNRKSKARELLDWAREEEENDGLRALVGDADSSRDLSDGDSEIYTFDNPMLKPPGAGADKKSRMQKEMEELERWLEDDEAVHADEDPWANIAANARTLTDLLAMTTSPLDIERPQPWTNNEAGLEMPPHSGFDDDFTVFVSAPAVSISGRSTPSASFDMDRLEPMHTGASYRSLGSVSDFGEVRAEDEDDIDLPSEAEIKATSSRIFGSSLLPRPPPLNRTATARPVSPAQQTAKPFSSSTSFSSSDGHASDDENSEEGDYEVGNFDLSRVLSALQNMKEEISGMDNEDERRKAAARAALGLVYGLERHDAEEARPM